MASVVQRKDRVNVSLPPYYTGEIDQLVQEGKFTSRSEVAAIAIQRFIDEYKRERKEREQKRTLHVTHE